MELYSFVCRPGGLTHVRAYFQVFFGVALELGPATLAAEVVSLAAHGETTQRTRRVDYSAADGIYVPRYGLGVDTRR
jgi:hypothetical protein